MAEKAIEFWRSLDLVGLQRDLDKDAEEIGKRREGKRYLTLPHSPSLSPPLSCTLSRTCTFSLSSWAIFSSSCHFASVEAEQSRRELVEASQSFRAKASEVLFTQFSYHYLFIIIEISACSFPLHRVSSFLLPSFTLAHGNAGCAQNCSKYHQAFSDRGIHLGRRKKKKKGERQTLQAA